MRSLFFLLVLLASPTWASLSERQGELKDLRSRIEQLREGLGKMTGEHAEASDALKLSEKEISNVNRDLRRLDQDARRIHRSLARLGEERRSTETDLRGQQARLAELVRQQYQASGEDSLRLFLSGRDPGEINRNLHYYAYLGRARAELIDSQRQSLQQLAALHAEIEAKQRKLTTVKTQQQSKKKELETVKATRAGLLNKLSGQIRSQRREIKTLEQDEQRLARLIARLRKASAAAKPAPGKPRPGQRVDQVASAAQAGLAFPRLRGKLALPVAGEIIARFGQSRDGGGPSWKGLFIRARQGQEIRAVGTGSVVFADWLRGFGNLLIIDHGGGYLSLYSNNESLYKQEGDAIRAGDVIAATGNTGGQEETGLYFELRHQGKPFDPLSWVAGK